MLVLRPSPVSGIGVFTTLPIAKGDHLRLWGGNDCRFVSFAEAECDPELWAVRDTYCVLDEGGYRCPLDFHRMSIGWYMNHSDRPNVFSSSELNFEYYASEDIAAGTEIRCDYRQLSPYESAPEGAKS